MKNHEEIKTMFCIEDEKIYFNNKGLVNPEEVTIIEDYVWSETGGMLCGSECNCIVVIREGKELTTDEFKKIDFAYLDKTERYSKSGEVYGKDNSSEYYNEGVNLSGAEVYILYNNYNNNNIDSYNIDIYTIK